MKLLDLVENHVPKNRNPSVVPTKLTKVLLYLFLSIVFCMIISRLSSWLLGTSLTGKMSSSSSMGGTFSIAYVSTPTEDVAKTIAKGLVKSKLAACVNIVPSITSIYEWKGEILNDKESLMIIKTRTSRMEELTTYVRQNHPYEVCEVISTPIASGNPPYLEWMGGLILDKTPS